jgi:hypothetical protein
MAEKRDPDAAKGAFESDNPKDRSENSLSGQLPHRNNPAANGADSDFPEPGAREEHSGEANPEAENQDQEPGFSQKRNQNQRKEDPLAS